MDLPRGKPCRSEERLVGNKQHPLRIKEKKVPGRLLKQPDGKIDGRRNGPLGRKSGRGIGWGRFIFHHIDSSLEGVRG
jgi:hypothetical protein